MPCPRALAGIALVLCCACARTYAPERIETLLADSLTQADVLLEKGNGIEASQFVEAAARIDPEYPGVGELRERISATPGFGDLFAPTWSGSNRARRVGVERPLAQKILLYLPDRVVDLLDCFTLEVHGGPGAYVDVHVTRAIQTAGGLRGVAGIGTYGNRSILGARGQTDAGLALLPAGAQFSGGALASAGGIRLGAQALAGLHRPTDALYQELDDYWGVGGSFTFVALGFTSELHPMQLADFLAGIAGFDLLNDDFARTRGLALSGSDKNFLLQLSRVARSRQSVEAYRASRQAAALDPTNPGE